jgi:hypothetical protein
MRFAAFIVMVSATAVAASDKEAELIDVMNANGCRMTTAQANEQMPQLGIDRVTAIALSREMMADGIAKFADDEETLLLLPPACKS